MDEDLIKMLAEYGIIDDQQILELLKYQSAQKQAGTQMPGLIESRGMNVTPSPLAYAGATLNQIMGGQDEQKAMAQMQANLLRKAETTNRYKRWAGAPNQRQMKAYDDWQSVPELLRNPNGPQE